MQHVTLGAAALHPDAKALQLAIPQHRFGAIAAALNASTERLVILPRIAPSRPNTALGIP